MEEAEMAFVLFSALMKMQESHICFICYSRNLIITNKLKGE